LHNLVALLCCATSTIVNEGDSCITSVYHCKGNYYLLQRVVQSEFIGSQGWAKPGALVISIGLNFPINNSWIENSQRAYL